MKCKLIFILILFASLIQADDTTKVSLDLGWGTFMNANAMTTNYGTKDSLKITELDDGEVTTTFRTILSTASEAGIDDFLKTSDKPCSCAIWFQFKANRGSLGATDTFFLYALRKHFDEAAATWQKRVTDTNWTTVGAGSTTGDYYGTPLDTFFVADTSGGNLYNLNCLRMLDSIRIGAWPSFFGFLIKKKLQTSGLEKSLILSSDDGAYVPQLKYWYIKYSPANVRHNILQVGNRHAPVGLSVRHKP